MEPVVAILADRSTAERTAREIRSLGLARVELLLPGEAVQSRPIPADDAESPGVGEAVGGVIGGATGASAGYGLGAVAASFLVPGIGAVTSVGLAAATLLAAVGAVGGAAAGAALEEQSRTGLPADEMHVYEHALAQGKCVLFAMVHGEEQDDAVRRILEAAGAESLDAARRRWWIGIRDPHELRPRLAETAYRRGFLAALRPGMEGKTFAEVLPHLRHATGELALSEAFREGYSRGAEVATTRARVLAPAGSE